MGDTKPTAKRAKADLVVDLAIRNASLLAQTEAVATELRTSEERFRLLVEGVRDYAIFLLDPAGHVTSWNQGAERIKGYRAEEIVGRHFSTFYQAVDATAGEPARGLRVAEQEGRFEAEGWRVRKDGSRFWANVVITALRDKAGRLRGFAKVTRDITERKRMQDQLLEAEHREVAKLREHADRMAALEHTKSQFLNLASHELGTPVSLIRGYLSLFEEGDLGELSESGKYAVSVMSAQARELHLLLGRMLEVARLEEGVDFSGEHLDLRQVAGEAVAAVRGQAGASHRFTLVAPDHTLPVVADRRQLRTAMDNLLDNSVKYSPEGGEVVCRVLAAPPWAVVEVQDHGLGMEPAQLEQLFRPFGRVITDHTAPILGAGLGLYLSREYARLQGGEITVRSEPGLGSTFTLRVPLAPSDGLAEAIPVPPTKADQPRESKTAVVDGATARVGRPTAANRT
jgi:PAS domain S-box-containing protein